MHNLSETITHNGRGGTPSFASLSGLHERQFLATGGQGPPSFLDSPKRRLVDAGNSGECRGLAVSVAEVAA
jgi:hypothetical protein